MSNFFWNISNLHHIIKLTMQEESNGELALFDNLLSKTMGIF